MSTFEGFNENDDDIRESYSFKYTDGDRDIVYNTHKDNIFWPDVLDKFLDFLSSVYGYDIRNSVKVDRPADSFQFKNDEDTSTRY